MSHRLWLKRKRELRLDGLQRLGAMRWESGWHETRFQDVCMESNVGNVGHSGQGWHHFLKRADPSPETASSHV